jgi:hypothetical protein
MNGEIIIALIFGLGIIYFGVKRYQEHKKENFEKRDN